MDITINDRHHKPYLRFRVCKSFLSSNLPPAGHWRRLISDLTHTDLVCLFCCIPLISACLLRYHYNNIFGVEILSNCLIPKGKNDSHHIIACHGIWTFKYFDAIYVTIVSFDQNKAILFLIIAISLLCCTLLVNMHIFIRNDNE